VALFRDDAGKTEKATPQRLSEARDKGKTPISREFTMGGSLLVAVLILELTGSWLAGAFEDLLKQGFSLPHAILEGAETTALLEHLDGIFATVGPPVVFLLAVFVAATALFGYSQIGFKWSKEVLKFKLDRMNPAANLGKLLGFSSVMKMILSAFKLVILGSVLFFVLRSKWTAFAEMHDYEELGVSVALILDMAFTVFFWIAFLVLVMAIVDVFWQRYDHQQSLMMKKQEVEDERKRSEGDPLIKSRLKQARMELMRHRMMEAVPRADVIITNPEHFSVAIQYVRGTNAAPEVVAKGVDDLAMRIREIARDHDVPIMEDPALARGLFRACKVGQEIPERFFRAVAAVLSHVYRMKDRVA